MKKHRVLNRTMTVIVCIMGSVPGLLTLLINTEGPFQRPDGPYWKALIIAVPSILIAILVGYFICMFLWRKWFKEEKSIIYQSFIIFSITIIAGLIAAIVGVEVNWMVAKVSGWGGQAQLEWVKFLIGIPIIFFYCIIPVGATGLLYGLFSFFYLKFSK
jgi:hypothetical protein